MMRMVLVPVLTATLVIAAAGAALAVGIAVSSLYVGRRALVSQRPTGDEG